MTSLQFSEGPGAPEPLLRGKQLLNHIVDGMAKVRPSVVWAEIPRSITSYELGFRKITYRSLANAINGVAWWLHRSLGPSKDFETLAYFGPWDVRYTILLLGAVKVGYKMVFPSPKYSIPGLEHLLTELKCKTMLTPTASPLIVSAFLAGHSLATLDVPSTDDLLAGEHPHYSFDKTFETARHEPLVVLHTSGTTSHPKPIVWTHDYAASFSQQHQLEPPPGYESMDKVWQGVRLLSVMPVFHAGHLFGHFVAIANQTTVIYPMPDAALSAQTFIDVLKHTSADVAIVSPIVAEQVGSDPAMLDLVYKKIDTLCYGGGDISQITGDNLARRGRLTSIYASTESGINPMIRPDGAWTVTDWKRHQFHPKSGFEFRHVADNDYEAFIVRNPIPEDEQPIFKTFPHLQEWSTGDLFSPDPVNPGSWTYRSRADDRINFIDGTTFNPLPFEHLVNGHPDVKAALIFGSQKPQAALLVELETPKNLSDAERVKSIERLWPVIWKANESCSKNARIERSHVVFTRPEKPLPRAGKGTVQRRPALLLYAEELEALYTEVQPAVGYVDGESNGVRVGRSGIKVEVP